MRYFQIPDPQPLPGIVKDLPPDAPPDAKPEVATVSFAELHSSFVWGDDAWLASGDAAEAHARCMAALADAKPGAWVGLNGDDFDIYKPILLAAGSQMDPRNPARAALLSARVALIAPVLRATAKPPKPEEDPDNA
jgi:hypothetical protein